MMDRRTKKTDMAILLAMEKLSQTRSVDEISISVICNEADISRQAFYARFSDPIDVIKQYVNEFVKCAVERMKKASKSMRLVELELCCKEYRQKLEIAYEQTKSKCVADYFRDCFYAGIKELCGESNSSNNTGYEIFADLVVSLVCVWLKKRGVTSIQTLARSLYDVSMVMVG